MAEKMTITAYSDNEFSEQIGVYQVQINPDSFTRNVGVTWKAKDEINKTNLGSNMPQFNPEKYSFTLYFDGTGVVPARPGGSLDVKEAVDEFLLFVYQRPIVKEDMNKEGLSSDEMTYVYVKLSYCGDDYNCVVDSVSVNYTLFDAQGRPLRAKLTCSFSSYKKPEEKPEKDKKKASAAPKPVQKSSHVAPQMGYQDACDIISGAGTVNVIIVEAGANATIFPQEKNCCC